MALENSEFRAQGWARGAIGWRARVARLMNHTQAYCGGGLLGRGGVTGATTGEQTKEERQRRNRELCWFDWLTIHFVMFFAPLPQELFVNFSEMDTF